MDDVFSKDHSQILAFPQPSDSSLKASRASTLERGTAHFYDLINTLLTDFAAIRGQTASYTCDMCGKEHSFEGRDLWCRLILVSAGYYAYSVQQLLNCKSSRALPKGFNLHVQSEFHARSHLQNEESADGFTAQVMVAQYIKLMFASHFTGVFRTVTPQLPQLQLFEDSAHNTLAELLENTVTAPHPDLRFCAYVLSKGVMHQLANAYSEDRIGWDRNHIPGPFSLINLRELSMIAKRDKRMMARYGDRRVEKHFEHQLALLFQSLGFYVVSTRLGTRTVDLICISAIESEPLTILVEAKTSAKPYSLPVSDQRALLEYLRDVKKSLTTLAPPSLVLIVGQEPATSLESRLRALESEAETPVRYVRAAELASLREAFPGPIHPSILRQTFIQSHTRIVSKPAKPIVDHERRLHEAHSAYVQTLLQSNRELAEHPWSAVSKVSKRNGCSE